jgi:hypothetical protein
MTEYANVDDLTTEDEQSTPDVVLPSGKTVRVRGLSRFEWFLAGKNSDGDANVFETRMVAMGMVTPAMTEKQAEKWRKRSGSSPDVSAVSDKIRELSGHGEGADKSDLPAVRDGSE